MATKSAEQVAIKVVQKRKPRAKEVTSDGSRDFLHGTVVRVTFTENGEEDFHHIYFDGSPEEQEAQILEFPDDVINLVNDNKKHSGLVENVVMQVFRRSGITGLLAILFSGTLCYLTIIKADNPVNENFWKIVLLIIGFYFGTKVPDEH